MDKNVQCPCCVGTGEIMIAKKTRGFEYKPCWLCNQKGVVSPIIADDYILSLNEEDVENYE